MAQRTCKHPDGCPRVVRKLGWCSMHYNRLRTSGSVGPAGKLNAWGEVMGSPCSVEGCSDEAKLKGWCRFHYNRVRFTGEVGPAAPLRRRLPPEVRAYTPGEKHRFYKYGLTPADFERILASQKHRCYVCGTKKPAGKGWSVDHCHVTKAVRFISCNPCNAALGLIKEDPKIARRLYEVALECQQLRLAI